MKVALIGLGSVGRGVAGMLAKKDLGIIITGIADSRSGLIDAGGIDIPALLARKKESGFCGDRQVSSTDVITKADYDALIEVTPTDALSGEPATGYIRSAISRKKTCCHIQ